MGQWRKANTGIQQCPRVDASVVVRVSTVDPETDPTSGQLFFRSAEETTANLSRGGAFVRSWEPLEAGRRVVVDIDLPGGDRLQLVARVAWTQRRLRSDRARGADGPGFGIQFTNPSAIDLFRLDRSLDGLAKDRTSTHSVDARTLSPQP
jgi:Tfp pilus assembly protein PilZ